MLWDIHGDCRGLGAGQPWVCLTKGQKPQKHLEGLVAWRSPGPDQPKLWFLLPCPHTFLLASRRCTQLPLRSGLRWVGGPESVSCLSPAKAAWQSPFLQQGCLTWIGQHQLLPQLLGLHFYLSGPLPILLSPNDLLLQRPVFPILKLWA